MTLNEIEENHHRDWQYKAPEYIDWLISRVRELEEGIRAHRASLEHLEPFTVKPTRFDVALYAVLDK